MSHLDDDLRRLGRILDPAREALTVLRGLFAVTRTMDVDYVLFGSAVLYLHGIRSGESVGDIDVFVTRHAWGNLLALDGVRVLTPRAGDPPFLEFHDLCRTPIHVFYDWTARDGWLSVQECFDTAEDVRGATGYPFRCASLATIRAHKDAAISRGHAKHVADVRAIDRYLTRA